MSESDACHEERMLKKASPEELVSTREIQLEVSGMGCINCATRVRNSLISLNGVIAADVDHLSGLASVRYNPAMLEIPRLSQAVVRAGGDGRHEYYARILAQT